MRKCHVRRVVSPNGDHDSRVGGFDDKDAGMFKKYPDLLTVDHIQEQTGLSKQTIRSLINDESLPGCKIGRRLYVPKAKFIAFVNGEM